MTSSHGFAWNIRIVVMLAVALLGAVFLITVPKGQAQEATDRGNETIQNASGEMDVSNEGTIINSGFEVSGQNGWTCFGDAAKQGAPDECVYFPSSSFSPSVEPQEGQNVGYVEHSEGACGIHGFGQRVVVPDSRPALDFMMKTDLAGNREAGVYILDADGNLITSQVHDSAGTSSWEEKEIDLSGSTGDQVQIIVGNAETDSDCDSSGQYRIWVDSFGFGVVGG